MHLKNKTDCPLCRGNLTPQDLIFSTEVSEEISTTPVVNNQESSKVNALIKELLDHKGEKALVYSQWTSMLDLIEVRIFSEKSKKKKYKKNNENFVEFYLIFLYFLFIFFISQNLKNTDSNGLD